MMLFFYLSFFWHTKKGINSSPVCFLGFPKHFLCIIHTGPSASRISCLSWTQDKSTHCRAHSTQTFQNMCWRVMPAGFRSKLHVMHPHTQSKGLSERSFSLTFLLANGKRLWKFVVVVELSLAVLKRQVLGSHLPVVCIYCLLGLTSIATSYGWLGTGGSGIGVPMSYRLLSTLSPPEWLH